MADVRATLRQVLGDGPRSDDFEQFVRFATRMRETYGLSVDPDVNRLVRFMELFSIAAVEGGREAMAELGDSPESIVEITHAMCTGASIALCSAVLSVLKDDTPASALRSIIMGSFRAGLDEVIRTNGLR